jgi:Ca2+-binding RTX toxin-like protein
MLVGGAGNDQFFFDTKPSASTNHDVIADFKNSAENNDIVYLDDAIYTALTSRSLGGAFQSNTTGLATQADDRIIYETDTGNLFYDSNGTAAGGSVLFATLTGHPTITVSDFIVF